MHVWEGIRLAFGQIHSQKLKSFFSVLGVVIGVMFLIVVVSVVEGLDQYIKEDFAEQVFGLNTVTLRRTDIQINTSDEQRRAWARRPPVEFEDAQYLRERLTLPVRVGVLNDRSGEIEGPRGRSVENVILVAATPEVFEIRDLDVALGRPFSPEEAEQGVPVAVLGTETVGILFPDSDPIGQRVQVRGFPYRVIGVLEEQGSILGQSLDNIAVMPIHSPIRRYMTRGNVVEDVLIQTDDPGLMDAVAMEAEGIMRVRRRLRPAEENNFALVTADASLSFWDRISRILFLALPGLVSISLVVGGIVIMNIMLVSVMERTREIGVRKAIGARQRDILIQVLIESATLSGFGALLGVGIGIGLTILVGAVSPLPAAVAPRWIAVGVALGVTVGVVAGVYPAARAARLDPVDALRYE
jgi:putative ABC transport system permease protein